MAITTGANPTVTTAARTITCLPAQTPATCICMQVVVGGCNNGAFQCNNCGQVDPGGACGFCRCDYTNRIVVLREGTCTEEIRFVGSTTVVCACCVTLLNVTENWCMVPATNDALRVSYLIHDLASAGDMCLAFDRKTQIFTSDDPVNIATAGFVFLGCGDTWQIGNAGSDTLTVDSCGFLLVGYCNGGTNIQGGIIQQEGVSTGCPVCNQTKLIISNGARFEFRDGIIQSIDSNDSFDITTGACSNNFLGGKIIKQAKTATILNNTTVCGLRFEGVVGCTCQTVEVEGNVNWNSGFLVNTDGFITTGTIANCAPCEIITIKCNVFINNTTHLAVSSNRIWNVINPSWTLNTTGQGCTCNITFQDGASPCAVLRVNENFTITATTKTPSGCAVGCSGLYVYEDLRTKLLAVRDCAATQDGFTFKVSANACGFVCNNFRYRLHEPCGNSCYTITTDGCHFLKSFEFGKVPTITALTSCMKFSGDIVMLDDPSTTGTKSAATCGITNIDLRYHGPCGDETNPITFVKFACGTGCTPTLGTTITEGNPCPATGTFLEFRDGCSASGTMVIRGRNAVDFSPCDMIATPCCMWTATICTGCTSVLCFTWSIDVCGSPCRTTQAIYNYISAKMGEGACICCASNSRFERAVEWGRGLRTLPLEATGSGACLSISTYITFQCGCAGCGTNPEGVALTRYSSGTIGVMTADCGATYSPPASATIILTNIRSGSDAYIFKNPSSTNTTPLASAACCVSCSCPCNPCRFRLQYTYCTPFCGCFQIKVFHLDYQPIVTIDCAGTSNKSIRIEQTIDRNFDDPV